jgi:hypothetical protein
MDREDDEVLYGGCIVTDDGPSPGVSTRVRSRNPQLKRKYRYIKDIEREREYWKMC